MNCFFGVSVPTKFLHLGNVSSGDPPSALANSHDSLGKFVADKSGSFPYPKRGNFSLQPTAADENAAQLKAKFLDHSCRDLAHDLGVMEHRFDLAEGSE
jgi:hypothetical protein